MVKLFSRSTGQGPPLVILHGLFGSSDNWQTFAKMLGNHFTVITIDLRNHGLSPHTTEFSYELISRDLNQFAEDHGLPDFYLMGHSLGGKAAAFFALQYPERVKKLIILDIAMKAYPPLHERYFEAMQGMDFGLINNRNEANAWLQRQISSLPIRQFLLKNLVRDTEGRFRWKFNLQGLYDQYDSINVAIESDTPFDKPVLILAGEHSAYIQPEDKEPLLALFPRAILKTIPDSGHWIHADQPEILKNEVVEFLE